MRPNPYKEASLYTILELSLNFVHVIRFLESVSKTDDSATTGADAKLARLRDLMAAHNVLQAETLALGDGANDIPMLQAAGLGAAYHAKPKVRAASAARIDHFDLTAALFLQGYRRSEFVTG